MTVESKEIPSDFQLNVVRYNKHVPLGTYVQPDGPIHLLTSDLSSALTIHIGRLTYETISKKTILQTTNEHPAILVGHHASFCYLLLSLNVKGEAILLHDQQFRIVEKITQYKETLMKTLGPNTLTLVGGIVERGDDEEGMLGVLQHMLSDSTALQRTLVHKETHTCGNFSLESLPAIDGYSGPKTFIYIPGQLSSIGKNTLLCTGPTFEETDNLMANLAHELK